MAPDIEETVAMNAQESNRTTDHRREDGERGDYERGAYSNYDFDNSNGQSGYFYRRDDYPRRKYSTIRFDDEFDSGRHGRDRSSGRSHRSSDRSRDRASRFSSADRYGRDQSFGRYGFDHDGFMNRYGYSRDGSHGRYGYRREPYFGRDNSFDRYGFSRDNSVDRYYRGRDSSFDRYDRDNTYARNSYDRNPYYDNGDFRRDSFDRYDYDRSRYEQDRFNDRHGSYQPYDRSEYGQRRGRSLDRYYRDQRNRSFDRNYVRDGYYGRQRSFSRDRYPRDGSYGGKGSGTYNRSSSMYGPYGPYRNGQDRSGDAEQQREDGYGSDNSYGNANFYRGFRYRDDEPFNRYSTYDRYDEFDRHYQRTPDCSFYERPDRFYRRSYGSSFNRDGTYGGYGENRYTRNYDRYGPFPNHYDRPCYDDFRFYYPREYMRPNSYGFDEPRFGSFYARYPGNRYDGFSYEGFRPYRGYDEYSYGNHFDGRQPMKHFEFEFPRSCYEDETYKRFGSRYGRGYVDCDYPYYHDRRGFYRNYFNRNRQDRFDRFGYEDDYFRDGQYLNFSTRYDRFGRDRYKPFRHEDASNRFRFFDDYYRPTSYYNRRDFDRFNRPGEFRPRMSEMSNHDPFFNNPYYYSDNSFDEGRMFPYGPYSSERHGNIRRDFPNFPDEDNE